MMSNEAHSSLPFIVAHQQMLREQLSLSLEKLHPTLQSDVICALQEQGKLLSQSTHLEGDATSHTIVGSWSLLPLLVAQHVRPDIDLVYAGNVAIAVECLVCALDLLDDIEDSDATPIVDALGTARVLNVSTALLMLAQKAIVSLKQIGIASDTIVCLLDTMQEAVIVATVGQHRDLLAEHRPAQDLTFEECIEIAAGKAGSLMRLACCMGALCADANTLVVEQFSELGKLLGISYQLDNDSHDMYYLLQ
ncbi:MAG: polyprenyl synthetase family protein, partial [Chloroflexota bacterium]|nr:polyprenyl synthetase family protein [Chloroflexota bacterium]